MRVIHVVSGCVLLGGVFAVAALAVAVPVNGPEASRLVFDGDRAFEHVRQVVAFGPRPAGSAAAGRTRDYIKAQLVAAGVTPVEQPFVADTPLGPVRMVNIRATLPGTSRDRLLIGGHYDTKLFKEFPFVGANDAGSSTGFLLELARSLKGRVHPFTIELVFFDGEEAVVEWQGTDRTYGSRHYVDVARTAGELPAIKALILVDMIGDRHLQLKRESLSTPWLTDLIWASARTLGYARHFSDEEAPIEDDHVPFLHAGVPAVNLIDFDFPAWHTAGDTLDQVSARSLEIVGTVLLDALPAIEERLARAAR